MLDIMLKIDSNPSHLSYRIRRQGFKRAYWHLRDLGATRYQALRSIFFAL
jgi:hypothetical protein